MRGLIGLIGVVICSVLLVLGLRYSIDHTHMGPVPRHHSQANSSTSMKAQDSVTFVRVDVDGEFHGLKVVSVVKGGMADKHFGLLPGDVVVGIGPFEMGDSTLVNFNAAREWIGEAYDRRNVSLRVERNDEELTLPIGGDTAEMVVAAGGADGSGDPSDKSPQISNPGGDE